MSRRHRSSVEYSPTNGIDFCRGVRVAADTAAVDTRPCEDVRGRRLLYSSAKTVCPPSGRPQGQGEHGVSAPGFKFVLRSWSRASTWRRDQLCRRTMAPIADKVERGPADVDADCRNGFKAGDLEWHEMFLVLAAPCHLCGWAGQEHGGSIPLTAYWRSASRMVRRRIPLPTRKLLKRIGCVVHKAKCEVALTRWDRA